MDALVNRMFIEPLLDKGYPTNDLPFLRRIEQFYKTGDDRLMHAQPDFIGIQNCTREVVKHSSFVPFVSAKIVSAKKIKVFATKMGWEIYPSSIYHMLHKFNQYNVKDIIATENGAAFTDIIKDEKIEDTSRQSYIEQNIEALKLAQAEGVKVSGYFVWSLTDNFEWAEKFHPRFGLVDVDYTTQKRLIKNSGYAYKKIIEQSST